MPAADHFRITASALQHWAIAQLQDSIAVGLLWLVGLWIIHVPWAPLWAVLASVLQIIPHFGPILGLLGPVLSAALRWQDWQHPFYVLILYAVIVVVDGFLLQPYIMRRVARVPMWASILVPIVLGLTLAGCGKEQPPAANAPVNPPSKTANDAAAAETPSGISTTACPPPRRSRFAAPRSCRAPGTSCKMPCRSPITRSI